MTVTYDENLNPIMDKIKVLLRIWSQTNLSLFGRIYIVKSLCISKLMHVLVVLPQIPESYIKTLNTMLFNYIWKNRNEKLRRLVLIGPWELGLGGATMVDLKSLIKTLHVRWICKVVGSTCSTMENMARVL